MRLRCCVLPQLFSDSVQDIPTSGVSGVSSLNAKC